MFSMELTWNQKHNSDFWGQFCTAFRTPDWGDKRKPLQHGKVERTLKDEGKDLNISPSCVPQWSREIEETLIDWFTGSVSTFFFYYRLSSTPYPYIHVVSQYLFGLGIGYLDWVVKGVPVGGSSYYFFIVVVFCFLSTIIL